jgi:adenosylcobyric acid synthase
VSGHGGNLRRLCREAGVQPQDLLDFSASINPLGPPAWLRTVVTANLHEVEHYPDPDCHELVEAISARYRIDPGRVVVGNGSAELLAALPRAVPGTRAVIPAPAYVDYAAGARAAGLVVEPVVMEEATGFALDFDLLSARLRAGDLVFIGRPNNPTGALCARQDLVELAGAHRSSTFVVDEAFVDFVASESGGDHAGLLGEDLPNLVVMRSFTKLYAIPGLRLGFAVLPAVRARALREALTPWSVNCLAQAVGVAALADEEYVQATRAFVDGERSCLAAGLAGLPGLRVFAGSANYLLAKLEGTAMDATDLARALLRRGMAIRVCDDFDGLDRRFFRVAVRTAEEDGRLLTAMRDILQARV